MNEKIIQTAGKAWRALGEKGETDIHSLAMTLRENEDLVNQAIGWLAREDKINYKEKFNTTFVSLVESELQSFKTQFQNQKNSFVEKKRLNLRNLLKLS
jgi:hypothetical protein